MDWQAVSLFHVTSVTSAPSNLFRLRCLFWVGLLVFFGVFISGEL